MNTPPDFSKYNKNLDVEHLKTQGIQALADELSYTRHLFESLDTIFQDSLDESLHYLCMVQAAHRLREL